MQRFARKRRHTVQSEILETRTLLTAPVATNVDIGSFNVGTRLQVDAADIVSEFGTDADGPLDATGLTFSTVVIDGTGASSLAAIGFVYSPGVGTAGGFTIDTRSATAFAGLGASDTASVVVDFTISDGVDSDSGEFQFEVLGENLGDINETFAFLGPTVVDQEVLAEADAAAGVLVDYVVAISGSVDVSDAVDELRPSTVGANAFDAMGLTWAIAEAVGSSDDSSEATAMATDGSFAQAIASFASVANAAADDRSDASATAEGGSAASATADSSSVAAAAAENGSVADTEATGGSVSTALASNASLATSIAASGSVATAFSDDGSAATALSNDASRATATAENRGDAVAVAVDQSAAEATARNTSDATSVAIENASATSLADDTSSANVAAGHGTDNTIEEAATAEATATNGSTVALAIAGDSEGTVTADDFSVAAGLGIHDATLTTVAADSSAANSRAADGSDAQAAANSESAAIGLANAEFESNVDGLDPISEQVDTAVSAITTEVTELKAQISDLAMFLASDIANDPDAVVNILINNRLERDPENPIVGASEATAVADGQSLAISASSRLSDAGSLAENGSVGKSNADDDSSATTTADNGSSATATAIVASVSVANADVDSQASATSAENSAANANALNEGIADAIAVDGSAASANASNGGDATSFADDRSAAEATADTEGSATASAELRSNATSTGLNQSTSVASARDIGQATTFANTSSVAGADAHVGSISDAVALAGSAASATASDDSDALSFAENGSVASSTATNTSSATTSAQDASVAAATADDSSTTISTAINSNTATAFAVASEVATANAGQIGEAALIEITTSGMSKRVDVTTTSVIVPVANVDVPIAVDAEELDGQTIDEVVISVPAGSVLSAGTPNGDGSQWTFSGPPPANLVLTPPAIGLTDYGVVTEVRIGDQRATASLRVLVESNCESVMPGSGVTVVGETLVVAGTDGNDRLRVQERKGEFRIRLNKARSTHSMDGITSVLMCGFDGTDRLVRPAKSSVPGILDGGNGRDRLTGSNADETLLGGGGDDRISARGGDDFIDGGNGRDKINAGQGNDIVFGGAGNDVVNGAGGRDILFGGEDEDRVKGGSGDDIMIGGSTDLSIEQLQAILAEWTSEESYEDRVTTIRTSFSAASITDTADNERLAGGGGTDWFFANESDVLVGLKDTEEVDLI